MRCSGLGQMSGSVLGPLRSRREGDEAAGVIEPAPALALLRLLFDLMAMQVFFFIS